jgi:hypothetical protein
VLEATPALCGQQDGNLRRPRAFPDCATQHLACALALRTLPAQAAATRRCGAAAFLGRFLPKLGGGASHRPFFALCRESAWRALVPCFASGRQGSPQVLPRLRIPFHNPRSAVSGWRRKRSCRLLPVLAAAPRARVRAATQSRVRVCAKTAAPTRWAMTARPTSTFQTSRGPQGGVAHRCR